MAISQSWFQSWQPPTSLIADHSDFHSPNNMKLFRIDHGEPPKRLNKQVEHHSILNYLPYLLTMGMFTAKDHHASHRSHHRRAKHPIPLERTGPFVTWYQWNQLDYAFESEQQRQHAIHNGDFIQKNNLPLGIEIWKSRLFVTMPKWKQGIPCTLAVLPRIPQEPSPLLVPYPDWGWHNTRSCRGLISVFRVQADTCGRLWVLDSGQIDISIEPRQICPPKIVVFDLHTDEVLLQYPFPDEFVKQDSLYSNIVVDIREGECEDVHAYVSDVWRFGLLVFSLKHRRSWRISDHLFYPDPLAAAYKIHDIEFEWTDGIFSLALSPEPSLTADRLLYFHPMSSYREFYVKTSIICNETGWSDSKDGFKVLGESRGKNGHASAAVMDKNGVLYYNLVSKDSIACWDSSKPYKRKNLVTIARNHSTLIFPNDMKIDLEQRPSIWIITNRLPFYLYRELDEDDVNFRIMSAYVDEAIAGTRCDPNVFDYDFETIEDGEDCY